MIGKAALSARLRQRPDANLWPRRAADATGVLIHLSAGTL
jgi:hypothetical protein